MTSPASPGIASVAPVIPVDPHAEPVDRWRVLGVLALGILLAEAPWFSASAVGPLIAAEWHPGGLGMSMLTVAVQLGFAGGALLLAITGAADVIRGNRLFCAGAILTGLANLGFAYLATDAVTALPFRALTGAGIAACYPVGMKMVAGWFRRERGVAVGFLLGALAVGTALPHALRAAGAVGGADWRTVVAWASIAAIAGGLVVLRFSGPGPFETPAPRFSLRIARAAFGEPSVRLANLGYLGHMWELFAMWTWIPIFLAASFAAAGVDSPAVAALAAFAVVASGGLGCWFGGYIADRIGRTGLAAGAMAISGACALVMGFLFGASPWIVLAVAVVWGVTVVADSPQFSVAVSELAPAGTAGSALSLQTASGFVLTAATILAIGTVDLGDGTGWRLAFGSLALGPAVGIWAMWRLRRRPDAIRMAGGRR